MKAIGVVKETYNNYATVVCVRSGACASCHDCKSKDACHAELLFSEQNQRVEVSVTNAAGAKSGDKVEIESSTFVTLFCAFNVFVVPFIATLFFYFLVAKQYFLNDFLPIALIVFFCLSFAFLGIAVNAFVKSKHAIYIVKVLEESIENLETK